MSTNPVQLDFTKSQPLTNQPAQTDSTQSTAPVTLDFSKAQPIAAQPSQPPSDEIQSNPSDSLLTTGAKAVGGLFEGAGEGAFGTLAGAGDLIDKATGMQPGAVSGELHTLAGDNNAGHGTAQSIGSGGEALAEFLSGDELLKGLSMSQRYLRVGKLLEQVESSPSLTRLVNFGLRGIRGGIVGSAQGALKPGDNAVDAGTMGAVGNAVVPEVFDAAKAAPGAIKAAPGVTKRLFSLKAVQDALANSKGTIAKDLLDSTQTIQNGFHDSVRGMFDSVAKDVGVQPNPADSLRDLAANVADAVKSKASGLYKQIDQALGGTRFQTFDEQLSNVKRALRNSAGIDPDADGRLIERVNDLEDAKAKAMDLAKANGVDPALIDEANSAWRQGSALEDLSKHLQASTSGLRGDLAAGVNAAPEALSPAKLATRANRMYSSGRLQQAIGDGHADDLLKAIESTKQGLQDAATKAAQATEAATSDAADSKATIKRNRTLATGAAGLVGVPPVWHWLQHLLGE